MSFPATDVHTSETLHERMVAALRGIVESHNSALAEGEKLVFENLMAQVRQLGGTDADSLTLITEGDLVDCGLPRLRARQAQATLRKMREASEPEPAMAQPVTADNADGVSVEALVAAFNPSLPDSVAGLAIRRRTKNRRCIVFDLGDGGGIHRKMTAQAIQELVDGNPERETINIGSRPVPLFRVGEEPPRFADEHPLYSGRQLRKDGTDSLGLNWRDGITKPVRQLLRFAVQNGEIVVRDNDRVREVHQVAQAESEDQIRGRYPRASVLFDQHAAAGKLPDLKVQIQGTGRTGAAGADPFFGARAKS